MKITDILNAIQSGQIRITDHADEEAQNDRLSYDEIFSSVLSAQVSHPKIKTSSVGLYASKISAVSWSYSFSLNSY